MLVPQSDIIARRPANACTCVQVLELKEPVEDERGFVYEKAAIENWITGHGRGDLPVDAPFAGGVSTALCHHMHNDLVLG